MLKLIAKITTLALILLAVISILVFMLFPKYPEFKIAASQIDVHKISHNTVLNLFTKLSPPDIVAVEDDLMSDKSLEHISPELLSKLQNEGKVLFNMEAQNTSLYISSVNIKGSVVDGKDSHEMDRGFWHFPLSSQPGQKGNTVIIAHRFLHLPPRTDTFFMLDKVKVGDKVIINQKDGIYRYTVTETKVVKKNDRTILEPTFDYRLTLVTCHPLWSSEQRFVVVGKLDKVYGNI
ncbi:class D sortase [bacterium]|nr:class D sortase [bacterium]